MVHSYYTYALGLFKENGEFLREYPVDPDWVPAFEWTMFQANRREALPAGGLPENAESSVVPVWNEKNGEPIVSETLLRIESAGALLTECSFDLTYFSRIARRHSRALVSEGVLCAGDRFLYGISAYPNTERVEIPPADARRGRLRRTPLPMIERSQAPLLDRTGAPLRGKDEDDVPVFIPGDIFVETAAASEESGANEAGGVLIGHVCRDPRSREMFIEVTAQIPALHTQSDTASLTFTPDTWADVRSAIALRRRGEIPLGWWHTHAYLKDTCQTCEKRDKGCSSHAAFFSEKDIQLHRTVFYGAHQVGLVLSDAPCSGRIWALYGWREGRLVERGYHALDPQVLESLSSHQEIPEGDEIDAPIQP